MSYGAVQTCETHNSRVKGGASSRGAGLDRLPVERSVGHRLLAEGGVRLSLPSDGVLTDGEARRLAWAILADLAPDECIPVAPFVTYREGQRLAVMRAILDGVTTINGLAEALVWTRRTVERRLRELREDGRVERVGTNFGPEESVFRVVA